MARPRSVYSVKVAIRSVGYSADALDRVEAVSRDLRQSYWAALAALVSVADLVDRAQETPPPAEPEL